MSCTNCNSCNSWPCVCTANGCCSTARYVPPPSPTPPWGRDYKTNLAQTLEDAGAVSLTVAETYLDALLSDFASPIAITIPNGTYQGQKKQIYYVGDLATGATWSLTGTFMGFTSLTFDATSNSAILNWNGAAWTMVSNAEPVI